MKVYLAGKMDAEYGAWRDAILGTVYDHKHKRWLPRWEVMRSVRDSFRLYDERIPPWPKEPNTHVLGMHDYVGPYRTTWDEVKSYSEAKNEGYFHGSSWTGMHGQMDETDMGAIIRECGVSISRADLVFVYLNRPDCFGTLAEIGMASAMGKYVYLVIDDEAKWDFSDYAFAEAQASVCGYSVHVWPDEDAPSDTGKRVLGYFKDAIIRWTARPAQASPLSLVPQSSGAMALATEAAQSFQQIARWSADPRVRDEAQRMLRRITA